MKRLYNLFLLSAMLIVMLGAVSATPVCSIFETTFISGIITDTTNGNAVVSGADITVNCNGIIKTTTSDSDGAYTVEYGISDCPLYSDISVSANYNGLNGESNDISWYTQNTQVGCLNLIVNVACANVSIVPEFGALVGVLTVLGALGMFFVVRRK
jgi:hypothetical protein